MTAYATTVEYLDRGAGTADLDALLVAAATSMEFKNDGNIVVVVSNASAGSVTATLKSQPDPYGRGGPSDADNDEVYTIAAGKIAFIPLMHPGMWNLSGVAQITLSSATSVTVGFIRLTKAR